MNIFSGLVNLFKRKDKVKEKKSEIHYSEYRGEAKQKYSKNHYSGKQCWRKRNKAEFNRLNGINPLPLGGGYRPCL